MDVIDFLNQEIERRDRRQAFLWALFLTIVTIVVSASSYVALSSYDIPKRLEISILGLSAIFFLVPLLLLIGQLLASIQPSSLPGGSAFQVLVVTRVAQSQRLASLVALVNTAEILAFTTAGVATIALGSSFSGPIRYVQICMGAALLLSAFFHGLPALLPREQLATQLAMLGVGAAAEGSGWKASTANRDPIFRELKRLALKASGGRSWKAIKESAQATRKASAIWIVLQRFVIGETIAAFGLFALLYSYSVYHGINQDTSLTQELTLGALFISIAGGFVALKLFLVFITDSSRRLQEQLRLALFLNQVDEEAAKVILVAIETLRRSGFFFRGDLVDLLIALDLEKFVEVEEAESDATSNLSAAQR